MDIMKGVAGFAAVPQQHFPSQMGPQDRLTVVTQIYYVSFAMGLLQVSFNAQWLLIVKHTVFTVA